jgi:hypothetical protein
MLVVLAFVALLLAFLFKVFGGPAETWLQPQALLYLGLAAWVLSGLVPWAPWPRRD